MLFFGGLLLLGFVLTPDYGMGWDEPTDRQAGYISLRYVAQLLYPDALANGYLQGLPELRTYKEGRRDLLFGAWCVGPLVLIMVIQSVVYDGWRHVYFIYPLLCC